MVTQTAPSVKAPTRRERVEMLRAIRTIVYADWRAAERRGHVEEEARCRAELDDIDAEIESLTYGRGW